MVVKNKVINLRLKSPINEDVEVVMKDLCYLNEHGWFPKKKLPEWVKRIKDSYGGVDKVSTHFVIKLVWERMAMELFAHASMLSGKLTDHNWEFSQ